MMSSPSSSARSPVGASAVVTPATAATQEALPYGGDLAAAVRAQDRGAIRILMEHRRVANQQIYASSELPTPVSSQGTVREQISPAAGGGSPSPAQASQASPAVSGAVPGPVIPAAEDLTPEQQAEAVSILAEVGYSEARAQSALASAHWFMEDALRLLSQQGPPDHEPMGQSGTPVQSLDPELVRRFAEEDGPAWAPVPCQPAPVRTGSSSSSRHRSPPSSFSISSAARAAGWGLFGQRQQRSSGQRRSSSHGRGRNAPARGLVMRRPMTPLQQQQAVQLVMAMGFDEQQALHALQQAGWSVELAIHRMVN